MKGTGGWALGSHPEAMESFQRGGLPGRQMILFRIERQPY